MEKIQDAKDQARPLTGPVPTEEQLHQMRAALHTPAEYDPATVVEAEWTEADVAEAEAALGRHQASKLPAGLLAAPAAEIQAILTESFNEAVAELVAEDFAEQEAEATKGPVPVGIFNYHPHANFQGDLPMLSPIAPAGVTLTGPDGFRIELGQGGALVVDEDRYESPPFRMEDPARIKRTWQELRRRVDMLTERGVPVLTYRFTVLMEGVTSWGDRPTIQLAAQMQACINVYQPHNYKLFKKALWAAITNTWKEYEDIKMAERDGKASVTRKAD